MRKITVLVITFILFSSFVVFGEDAPVTMAGNITNAIPGASSVSVPVTVYAFNNVGKFILTMKFDTTRVRFVSAVTNSSLTGMTVVYTRPSGNTIGTLVFNWTGVINTSLADGASIADLTFSYVSGSGLLSWSTSYGAVCQYKRYVNGTLTLLNSSPQYLFYKNGGISNRGAPVTNAPAIGMAAPGSCSLPVTVNGFTGIGALTLYLEYDPTVITYLNTFTKNAAFGSTFLVGNVAGANGKMRIVIQWFGSSVTLANGATMCTLNFNYTATGSASTTLAWYDNISSCEYADAAGDVLIDLPQSYYYHDGVVAPALIANFSANNLTPQKNETVVFTDLTTGGATTWAWSFDRPGVVFVNGTTASSQNPQVIFTDGGPYSVTLLCTSSWFTDSEIKAAYLRAGISGLWTGNTSTDWNTQSNWDNWLVPGNTVSVVIPPAAANWPVYDGDLTIGVQCGSLTLSGATSIMTVTGNLTIPSP